MQSHMYWHFDHHVPRIYWPFAGSFSTISGFLVPKIKLAHGWRLLWESSASSSQRPSLRQSCWTSTHFIGIPVMISYRVVSLVKPRTLGRLVSNFRWYSLCFWSKFWPALKNFEAMVGCFSFFDQSLKISKAYHIVHWSAGFLGTYSRSCSFKFLPTRFCFGCVGHFFRLSTT